MKRIILSAVVAVIISGAVFARGSMEGNGQQSGTEEVSLTGTVVEYDGQPVLETSEGRLSISARGFARTEADIPWGETVEVSGSLKDPNTEDCDGDRDIVGHLFVERAVVDGTEYSFAAGQSNGKGRNSGRQGNRGNQGNGGSQGDGNRSAENGRTPGYGRQANS